MDLTASRCWVEIDLDALAANCRALHRLLPPGCRLMNILKANASAMAPFPRPAFWSACSRRIGSG